MLITVTDRNLVDGLRSYTIPTEPFNIQVPPSTHAVDTNLDPELDMSLDRLEGPSYVRGLRAFPPPLFSRQGIPQGYKCVMAFNAKFTLKSFLSFRANTASVITTTTDEETGEERKRMINRMRWKGYGPASVMFSDSQVRLNMCFDHLNLINPTQVPDKPPQAVENERGQVSDKMYKKLEDVSSSFCLSTLLTDSLPLSAFQRKSCLDADVPA